jgi:hypothetical protein
MVIVRSKPMVVLRMIVISISVGVQKRHHARHRDQRPDEQHGQDAAHNDESMRRGHPGQKDGEGLQLSFTFS